MQKFSSIDKEIHINLIRADIHLQLAKIFAEYSDTASKNGKNELAMHSDSSYAEHLSIAKSCINRASNLRRRKNHGKSRRYP